MTKGLLKKFSKDMEIMMTVRLVSMYITIR